MLLVKSYAKLAKHFMTKFSKEQLTIARILKVNHAGEYGAIRIYTGQLKLAKILYKDLALFLEETLQHEIKHCNSFESYMPCRKTRPCGMIKFWGIGGYLLGTITALMGRNSIMVCTAAVESAVHIHLNEQIDYLRGKDNELQNLIKKIRVEELQHLKYAEDRLSMQGWIPKMLYQIIVFFTNTIIWLSTWGDVTRMKNDIIEAK
ncbi:MAG: demethoxyubiquinone hydroxylase family protein [Rickettsiales bacterium]|nr:demethoxyubiquinone hydroxylase family protein [Pseudomonadota bacterium]MDA0967160.1 demethoxyubiquinone hydroxylase family protein [Pseudomonadota bacterium]MDG4544345.1 demethoxyubiquinone hydroxylase family protein [Rickettsiales bacterium]MDG4546475.1 demethoxyubiquinone hydroxylase family protein [Rickettsiales bacterium]MDG4548621.1 demethoxyubiquinone hydroxylase family protein [Rickettsiales bacterium]